MCDEWMPVVQLAITIEQFHKLPRHPAYKYAYLEGQGFLTPRPKFYHAILDLTRTGPVSPLPQGITLRMLRDEDIGDLEYVFSGAFERQQPYASLEREQRQEAAQRALAKTLAGGDGPLIRQASFVAIENKQQATGGIFVTLLPDEDPADWDSFRWRESPPADCIERRLGRPHVTWVFVSPWSTGMGTGTALLGAAVSALRGLGFRQLASTFMLGNDSSMLWHWRNGFQLHAYPGSHRRWEHYLRDKVTAGNMTR
jgi:GNAT superfamily N-acetyltransferase